jgi:hypothetical protein
MFLIRCLAAGLLFVSGAGAAPAEAQQNPPASSQSSKPKAPASAAHPGSAAAGANCPAVLQLSSTDWIAQYGKDHSASEEDTLKAIDIYAKCYDARSTRLAATLGKSGKGPLMGANGNFRDFQAALKDFSAKALADTIPPADPVKSAYATLYAMQFRYEFLEGYTHKADQNRPLTADESDEMTKAKNRFGELLGLLKTDQFHEVHSAFSKVLESVNSDVTKLEVYRYGIFLLARPGEKAFSAPPI